MAGCQPPAGFHPAPRHTLLPPHPPLYFFHIAGSASILMNSPPTTLLAWNPCCFAVFVSYQSVSGTRLAESLANCHAGATIFSKSPAFPASVAAGVPSEERG